MIAEIVSNGMLSLPSSLAVVGIVPGLIIIVFLGVFGTFTAWVLIQFKLRHPEGKYLSAIIYTSSNHFIAAIFSCYIAHPHNPYRQTYLHQI